MQAMQPFDFIVSLWGERYRNYFVDRCLPTLLAEGNFPVLRASEGHRLLIATTQADWQAMTDLPVMQRVREFVTPQFFEVAIPEAGDAAPGGEEVIRHHAKCQKQLCEVAFRDRAYGSVVFPDTLYSTGAVAALLRYARAGHRLVLCAALRQIEESVLAELDSTGILPLGSKPSLTGQALSIPPRQMADLAVRHLHPEVAIYDWDYIGSPSLSAHRFWRVPGRRGLILRTFYGLPVLMDYRAIETHNTECLDRDIFENVYVRSNFAECGGLHVVQDSDDFMLISLTPEAVGEHHAPTLLPRSPWLHDLDRESSLRASMHYFVGRTDDGLKGALFNCPMYWHSDDLDETWTKRNRQISQLLRRVNGDYGSGCQAAQISYPRWLSIRPRRLLGDLYYYGVVPSTHVVLRGVAMIADAVTGRNGAWSRLWSAIRRRVTPAS